MNKLRGFFAATSLAALLTTTAGDAIAMVVNFHLWDNSARPRSQLAPLIANGSTRPVSGVEISLGGGANGQMMAVTDENGFATVDGPLGVYNVFLTGGDVSGQASTISIELADPDKPGYYLHTAPTQFYQDRGLGLAIRFSHPTFEIRIVEDYQPVN